MQLLKAAAAWLHTAAVDVVVGTPGRLEVLLQHELA
jgi:superfamily II DNA/RNA helicase